MSTGIESITTENVVATADIGAELDLDTLSGDLNTSEYDPDHFPGLVYRMEDPKAVALIFRSGKVVCTGATSAPNVRTAMTRVFEMLQELGVETISPDIAIVNMVFSANLGPTLNLNAIAIGLGLENIEYEPEQFPGLVYRLEEPDVVTLLFGSGKLVITGGKTESDAERALETITARLSELGLLE
ncbi:TATA-box-binding protein [Haloarcula sp. CGMCC 1.2071]|uniref:TATA-box-binding protein n=1 Tax=Haloarcula sp. CGMCC 1.2071 TaxID=3111454 RepID=UPI00300E8047